MAAGAIAAVLLPAQAWAQCPDDAPPQWCEPDMVPLVIVDAEGKMEGRQRDGEWVRWSRPAWGGSLYILLKREQAGVQVVVAINEDGTEPVKTVRTPVGGTVELQAGRELPTRWLGKRGKTVKLVVDSGASGS